MIGEFRRRRDAFCAELNRIPGFRCPLPGGAFYAFPNVEGTGIPSRALADMLLEEAGVAALDGGSFGEYGKNNPFQLCELARKLGGGNAPDRGPFKRWS